MRPGGPSDSPSRVQSCTWCLRPLESTGHALDEDDSDEVGKVAEDTNEEEAKPDDLDGSVDEDDPEEGSEEVGVPVDANDCVGVTLDDNGSVGDFAFVFLPIPFLARRSDVGACFLPFVIPLARSRGTGCSSMWNLICLLCVVLLDLVPVYVHHRLLSHVLRSLSLAPRLAHSDS